MPKTGKDRLSNRTVSSVENVVNKLHSKVEALQICSTIYSSDINCSTQSVFISVCLCLCSSVRSPLKPMASLSQTLPNAIGIGWMASWSGSLSCCPFPRRFALVWTNCPSSASAWGTWGSRATSKVRTSLEQFDWSVMCYSDNSGCVFIYCHYYNNVQELVRGSTEEDQEERWVKMTENKSLHPEKAL